MRCERDLQGPAYVSGQVFSTLHPRQRRIFKNFDLGSVAGHVIQAYGRLEFEDVLDMQDWQAAVDC